MNDIDKLSPIYGYLSVFNELFRVQISELVGPIPNETWQGSKIVNMDISHQPN